MRYRDIRGPTDPAFTARVVTYFDTGGQLTEAGRRWQDARTAEVDQLITQGRRQAARRSLAFAAVFVVLGLLMWPHALDWSNSSGRLMVAMLSGIVAGAVTWDRTARRRRARQAWLQRMQVAELDWARAWAAQTPPERDRARRTFLATESTKLAVRGLAKVASKTSGIAWDVYTP